MDRSDFKIKKMAWILTGAAIFFLTIPLQGQQSENEKLLSEAREQCRLRKYENAIRILGGILDKSGASLGDDTVVATRKMYFDTVIAMAEDLARKDLNIEGTELLIRHSKLPIMSEQSALLKDKAELLIKGAYDSAIIKKNSENALDLAKAWSVIFPDKNPLANDQELLRHRIDRLVRLAKVGNPRTALQDYRKFRKEGVSEDLLRESGLKEGPLTLRYAKVLYERGWYRQSASLLRDQLRNGFLTGDEKSEAERIEEQSLINHASACIKFNNLGMIRQAYEVYMDGERSARQPVRTQSMKSAIDKLVSIGEAKELKFPGKFVEGKGVWKDAGHGYFISNTVQTGNCANSRGGPWKTAEIEVAPGSVIEGGILRASHGKLTFQGTAEKPVIIRNVRLECDYTAAVHATYTLFVDCTFSKTGSWHWNGGFSSKWNFSNCMLVRSNFSGLSRGDYGIRWQQTVFFRCKFPQRVLNSNADKDATLEYKGHWNMMNECIFMESVVPPSLVWGCDSPRLIDNEVSGTSEFYSAKPMKIAMSASPPEFVRALRAATLNKGRELVEYSPLSSMSKPPIRGYWNLLQDLEEQ